jgi:hypothetical protein
VCSLLPVEIKKRSREQQYLQVTLFTGVYCTINIKSKFFNILFVTFKLKPCLRFQNKQVFIKTDLSNTAVALSVSKYVGIAWREEQ